MTRNIPGEFLRRPVRVLVVGCGGNCSAIIAGLPYLHQAMIVRGHPGGLDVTLMDGDLVAPTNCIRQPFSQSEIGHSKAVILASRVNLFWNLNWHGIPHHLSARTNLDRVDIVVGCVDSRGARKLIAEKTSGQRSAVYYWLDLGNHATGGQFVLGQPWNWANRRSAARLRTVAELFPELIDASLDDDRQPSCSAVEALERQEPFVNPTLANHALALLAKLFRHGSIEHHGAFVNVAGSRVQPLIADIFAALIRLWLRGVADLAEVQFFWPLWSLLDHPAFLQRKRRCWVELDFVSCANEAADETAQLQPILTGKPASRR